LIYHGPQSYTHVKSYGRLNSTRASVFNFEHFDKLCAWIGNPSEMLWPFEFLDIFHFSISSAFIYHRPQYYIHVKSYGRLNWTRAFVFSFKRLDILCAWIGHPNEMLWPFQYLKHYHFQFRASRYIIGLHLTPMSKVMAVWIGLELPCSISSVSIYYVPESNIRVKSYDHLNFSRTSIVQFRASRYIMGLNRTSILKVIAIWIGPVLSCSISSVSIYYVPESDIRVKFYDHLNFPSSTIFQFQASRYIMGLNRTPMSTGMVVWIRLELSCLISGVSIYYVPESDILVKSYDHLNFSRTTIFQFRVCQYIIGLNHTSMLKVMAGWIGPRLSCLISSVSIYYLPESDIQVKCYDHLNISRTSVFQFRVFWYIMGLIRTPMSIVMVVWIQP